MSYEYFLQAHLRQEPQEIPTESIIAIFKDFIVEKGDTYIDLQFDEQNGCTIYIDTEEPNISSFMVSRPCGGSLGECLYNVMLLGNFVFFEPDGKYMIAVKPSVEEQLPVDMIETLGKPIVAENLEAFLELYFNNR